MKDENLKKIDPLSGFSEVFDHIATKDFEKEAEKKDDDQYIKDSDDDQNDDNQNNDDQDDDINSGSVGTDDDQDDDSNDSDDDQDEDQDDDLNSKLEDDDDEEAMITPFVELFADKLGWELDDKTKPKDIDSLINFIDDIIENNSKPKYFSDEIRQLDEFVKNGGDIRNFLTQTKSGIDLDNIDMSKETNQKAVIIEHMKNLKYSDERIAKKIERFEESGILEEEAEEAVDYLKSYRQEKEEKLLKEQQKQAELKLKEQQKFISTVENTIMKTDTILGIPLNNAQQKKELIDYILKVDAQGRTKNQIDYSKDPIQRLIETAFVQKEGNNFQKRLKTEATNNAVSNFKNKLKSNKSKRGTNQRGYQSGGGSLNLISSIASQLM